MSKFCNNCGVEMEDDVVFCPNCGAQDAPANDAPAASNVPDKKILILGGIAAAIVALIVLIALIAGGPKRALNRYEKVINGKGKIEKLFPEDYIKELKKDDEDFSKSEWLDKQEEGYENSLEAVQDEYGDNAKYNLTIVEKKKMNKDDREDYAEYLEKAYGIEEKSVKSVYRVAVKVNIKGKDGKTFYYDQMIAAKIDGKWYITEAF